MPTSLVPFRIPYHLLDPLLISLISILVRDALIQRLCTIGILRSAYKYQLINVFFKNYASIHAIIYLLGKTPY